MENFVNRNLVECLRLGTRPLECPIKLRNIDGTFNTTGKITHYIDLMMCRADKKVKERFYITGLSGIELILGYPWLRDFNPQVDWPTNTLPGPPVEIKTPLQDKIAQYTKGHTAVPMEVDPVDLVIRATIIEPTPTFPEELVRATQKAVAGMTKEQVHALIFEAAMPQIHLNQATPKKQDPPPSTPQEQEPVEDLSTTGAPEIPKKKTTEEQIPERYHNFLDIFEKPIAGQLPPHHEWDLKVRLVPNAPSSISCTPYPLSHVEQVFQDKYIKENLAHRFIRESNSPYSTPIFYNKKKDGTFWPLFNYRKINAITIKDVSPLPRITTILEDTVGAVLFSKFNLREGYYNVAVEEESQDILAFKTTDRLYTPRVMPFGPMNCPAIMQKFMNHVFRPLYDRYGPRFKNYMDDCGIFTRVGELNLHRQIT
jgi:Reverse transcriptase (RNA-dependent DNA polymerase)